MRFLSLLFCFVYVLCIAFSEDCWAQEPQTSDETTVVEKEAAIPSDAMDRGTPRRSVKGFLNASSELDYQKAARYLDLRNLPPGIDSIDGAELARQLNHVLSLTVWLDEFSISDDPEGMKGDDLPAYRDVLVVIESETGDYSIWMQRMPREDGELIWKISNRSVSLIPLLYGQFSYPEPVEKIRKWFPTEASFLGIEAFKWFILLVLIPVSLPLAWVLGWALSHLFCSPDSEHYPLVRKLFTGPFMLLSALVVFGLIMRQLGVSAYAQALLESQTLITIAVVWSSWLAINLLQNFQQIRFEKQGRPGIAKILRPISTLVKLIVLTIGVLYWLNNLGVNISAVLAGLGIGGLAVALALQKPIEDMMGAISMFSQANLRVGDFCGFGDRCGTVEEIGLRTTRIRTQDNTVVAIPNSQMAYAEIENYSTRKKIRYCPWIRLSYETTAEQLRLVTQGILEMLENDQRVREESLLSRFTEFGEDAMRIRINSYIRTTNYFEFLEISEDLNIKIVEIVQDAGAQLALPSHSVKLEQVPKEGTHENAGRNTPGQAN